MELLAAMIAEGVRGESLTDMFPWLQDFVLLFLGLGLIGVMVYLARFRGSVTGFVIRVDEEGVTFSGQFPPGMQGTVTDFLREDCRIEGAYQIRGHWEDRVLIVVVVGVRGGEAKGMEQQIRNFLKLNLKPPRGS